MTTVTRRSGRVADVLNWLDGPGLPLRGGFGLLRDLRVEDYFEDGVLEVQVPFAEATPAVPRHKVPVDRPSK